MPSFTINSKECRVTSAFAIGVNTGSLFLMVAPNRGIVIVGKGELKDKEGILHVADPNFFTRLVLGTVIEVTT